MKGRLLQVNVSPGGVPKKPVAKAFVNFERVEGDDWRFKDVHGGPKQVILMIANETIADLSSAGYPVFPGALGENFTTEDLDYRRIRFGDRFRAGAELEFRITKLRAPCRTIRVYGSDIGKSLYDSKARDHDPTSERWGRGGFYAEILKEGSVQPGDTIERIYSGERSE